MTATSGKHCLLFTDLINFVLLFAIMLLHCFFQNLAILFVSDYFFTKVHVGIGHYAKGSKF